MALVLKRHGVERVRPLAGGYDAWTRAGYPIEPLAVTEAAAQETTEADAPGGAIGSLQAQPELRSVQSRDSRHATTESNDSPGG